MRVLLSWAEGEEELRTLLEELHNSPDVKYVDWKVAYGVPGHFHFIVEWHEDDLS